jgi:hypothetical protein
MYSTHVLKQYIGSVLSLAQLGKSYKIQVSLISYAYRNNIIYKAL